MKTIQKFWVAIMTISTLSFGSVAQNVDPERMNRDIEVAENVLSTLIKQEFEQQRTLFGLDVKGSYQPGYGVTFRVPADHSLPFVFSIGGNELNHAVIADGYSYTIRTGPPDAPAPRVAEEDSAVKLANREEERRQKSVDSVRSQFNNKIIRAAQNFILDYGDIISQLGSNERLVVTNQSDRPQVFFAGGSRTRISVEGTKSDITAFRQGKMGRDQALKKLTIVNTESLETKEPDMEMLSSIFSRLYRPDLSKTYFVEGNVYYERLKDFGAVFYLQMVSSVDRGQGRHVMPTLGVDGLTQADRDKKVADLYPQFEQELKDNILEYGRTVKTLKDDESLIFNVAMTRCKGCGIPSTLELGIKGAVLKDFSTGKIDKNTALSKMAIKKGASQ